MLLLPKSEVISVDTGPAGAFVLSQATSPLNAKAHKQAMYALPSLIATK